MAVLCELLDIELLVADESRGCSKGNLQLLAQGWPPQKLNTEFVALWSGSIFCFQDVNLFTRGKIQTALSFPCTSPSTVFPRTANSICVVFPTEPLQNAVFSFPAC